MAVFRVERDNNYAVMSNYHFKEKKMSLKAKGLLSEMLSLSDDWDYSSRGLSKINKEGKNSINKILQELEEFGYLERVPVKNEKGLIVDWNYIIYEKPCKIRCTENEDMENEDMENGYINKILNNKELKNKTKKEKIDKKENSEESLKGDLPKVSFIKPTIDEIKKFLNSLIQEILEYNKTADDDKKRSLPNFTAEKFYYYYETVDWYVGKRKMKNWQAAIRKWISNDSKKPDQKQVQKQIVIKNPEVPDWFDKELENEPLTETEQNELNSILDELCGGLAC